jgi:hypothetical protein
MARCKPYLASILVFTLVVISAATVSGAILEKASQLISLVSTAANPLTLSAFKRRLPTGEAAAYTLPPNTVFVLTKLSWNFTATDTNLNGDILFTVGNYYRAQATLVNGYVGAAGATSMGIPISNMSQKVTVSLFGDSAQTPVPGTISIRLVGHTAPNN